MKKTAQRIALGLFALVCIGAGVILLGSMIGLGDDKAPALAGACFGAGGCFLYEAIKGGNGVFL